LLYIHLPYRTWHVLCTIQEYQSRWGKRKPQMWHKSL